MKARCAGGAELPSNGPCTRCGRTENQFCPYVENPIQATEDYGPHKSHSASDQPTSPEAR